MDPRVTSTDGQHCGRSFYAFSPEWKERNSCKPRWHVAPWRPMNLCVAWIMLEKLPDSPNDKTPPRFCSATKSQNGNQLLRDSLKLSDRLVNTSLRRFCLRWGIRHGPLAQGQPLVFYVFSAMVCVRRSDFTQRVRNKDAELGVKMNQILSRTTMNALSCTTSSPRSGGTLYFSHGFAIYSMTLLLRSS